MKILYHHRTQGRGAEGTHIVSIVRGFRELGHEVTIISPPGVDPLKEVGAPPVDKTQVKTKGMQRVWKLVSKYLPNPLFELAEMAYNIPAYRRLKAELKANHYDMIFERYAFFLLAGAWASRKFYIPLAVEANEVSGIEHRARRQSFPRICDWFEKRLFQQASAIFPVSSKLRDMILAKGIPADKVHVMPNAIDMKIVKVSDKIESIRQQYPKGERTLIGFAGWFDNWDRLDFLLDVKQELSKRGHEIAIMLIGDGPALQGIREYVDREGLQDSVFMTGAVRREDIFTYLSLLDIAVLPHSNDFGSPVIMFEMMSLEKPILAPKLPPILDVLTHGETAMLFDPLDLTSCSDALQQYLESPEKMQQCASASHELLLQAHTWVNNSRRIIDATMGKAN